MNDQQIEDYILGIIERRGITWLDMVSGRSISYEAGHKRLCRINKFKSESWSERMVELLHHGDSEPFSECHTTSIPYSDLFQFWWNQIIDQQDMMDDILEEIYIYFKDRIQPIREEAPALEYEIDFSKLSTPANNANISHVNVNIKFLSCQEE